MIETKAYQPIDLCIYCGSGHVQEKFTDEHIIPYGLGGKLILPSASCKRCQDATSKVELFCLQRMLGNARIHLNSPTRRPKKRPKSLATLINVDGRGETRSVSIPDHPFIFILPSMEPAGFFMGSPDRSGHKNFSLWFRNIQPDTASRIRQLGTHEVEQCDTFNLCEYGRMLAKISHAYACAEMGMNSFEPLLSDIIRGLSGNVSGLIGGSRFFNQPTSDGLSLHEIELHHVKHGGALYLVSRIQLFALLQAPSYEVVVGRL
jgi:hypothetical protein